MSSVSDTNSSSESVQRGSRSSTAYSVASNPPADRLPRHHSTLYEECQTRKRIFWNRLQGKGRNVPGWWQSTKNIFFSSWLNWKFFLFPLAWTSHFLHWSDGVTYYLCFVSIIPLVKMADWGATLAIVLLRRCELRLLHATIIGVVVLHLLLIPGVAFLVGGARIWEQNLHPHHTQLNHSLLAVGVLTILLPTAFFAAMDRGIMSVDAEGVRQYAGNVVSDETRDHLLRMSRGLAIILLIVYVGSRIFLHNPPGKGNAATVAPNAPLEFKEKEHELEVIEPQTNPWMCMIALVLNIAVMAVTTEFLLEANEGVRENDKIGEEWFGLVFLPLLSYSADGVLALSYLARQLYHHFAGKQPLEPSQLAKGRTIDLSIQFTLFWMPLLVLLGWWMNRPMHLLFDYYEVAVILGACFLVNYVTADYKTNWIEGLILLAFYVIIATVTWFYDGQPELDIMANCPESVAYALTHGVPENDVTMH